MPSFLRNSSRSYSYPPCIDSVDFLSESPYADLPPIDEEPFAHFLSPVNEEDDPYDALSLSAGIIIPDGPKTSKATKFKSSIAKKWARYVATNHETLHELYHDDQNSEDEDEESFMSLDDPRLIETPYSSSPNSPPKFTVTAPEPTRGRAQELVNRSRTKGRGRRRLSRTLSGHRHSYREPSPDLFTVMETDEPPSPTLLRRKTMTKDGAERLRSGGNEVVEKAKL